MHPHDAGRKAGILIPVRDPCGQGKASESKREYYHSNGKTHQVMEDGRKERQKKQMKQNRTGNKRSPLCEGRQEEAPEDRFL